MSLTLKFDSVVRSAAVSLAAVLALSACGDKGSNAASAGGQSVYEVEGDHGIGNPDAAVTVVEYASVTCGHCANWHTTVYPDFKKQYVDTGKVRYVFREFPTPPEDLAKAGFLIANCADEDRFLENISLQFERQRQILGSPDIRQEYQNLARASGLSSDDFEACMLDEQQNERLKKVIQGGIDAGVTGTPAFFINGKKISKTDSGTPLFTVESFAEVINPILGEPVPQAHDTDNADETASEHTDKSAAE